MKIAFHDNSLCLRGTTVAIYDWAYWTRQYLDIDPIIMFNLKNNFNDESVIKKFENEYRGLIANVVSNQSVALKN